MSDLRELLMLFDDFLEGLQDMGMLSNKGKKIRKRLWKQSWANESDDYDY